MTIEPENMVSLGMAEAHAGNVFQAQEIGADNDIIQILDRFILVYGAEEILCFVLDDFSAGEVQIMPFELSDEPVWTDAV